MTYTATPEEQARKLRLAASAAASAVGNGCSVEEVMAAIEEALQQELRRLETRAGAPVQRGRHAAAEPEEAAPPKPEYPLPAAVVAANEALDELDRLLHI